MNSFQNVIFIFTEYHILVISIFKYLSIVNICILCLIYKWHFLKILVLVKYVFSIIDWTCLIITIEVIENIIWLIFVWQRIFEVCRIKIYLCKLVNYSKNENVCRILENFFKIKHLIILIFTFLVRFKTKLPLFEMFNV